MKEACYDNPQKVFFWTIFNKEMKRIKKYSCCHNLPDRRKGSHINKAGKHQEGSKRKFCIIPQLTGKEKQESRGKKERCEKDRKTRGEEKIALRSTAGCEQIMIRWPIPIGAVHDLRQAGSFRSLHRSAHGYQHLLHSFGSLWPHASGMACEQHWRQHDLQ